MSRISHFSFLSLLLLTLISCGPSGNRFRLKGHFRNLNQGEFYLYSTESGRKDTIAVRDGRFSYETTITDTTTLVLIFPNYSEIPIFARPGISIKMKGDASHLRETEVEGSDENEEMTAFRLRANNLTPPKVKQQAKIFILQQPASPVSLYLLRRHFIMQPSPDYAEALTLCETIHQATHNSQALKLSQELKSLKNASVGQKLPTFTTKDTKGNTVSQKQLSSDVNVVCLWASWNAESRNIITQIRKQQKANPGKISVISVSLDATPEEDEYYIKRDSISWPNICDGKMWQTPLAAKFGFATVPAVTIADKTGKIVARNLSQRKQVEEEIDKLLMPKK